MGKKRAWFCLNESLGMFFETLPSASLGSFHVAIPSDPKLWFPRVTLQTQLNALPVCYLYQHICFTQYLVFMQ